MDMEQSVRTFPVEGPKAEAKIVTPDELCRGICDIRQQVEAVGEVTELIDGFLYSGQTSAGGRDASAKVPERQSPFIEMDNEMGYIRGIIDEISLNLDRILRALGLEVKD